MLRFTGLIMLALLLVHACISEQLGKEVDCADCYPFRPAEEQVTLQLTMNEVNREIPLVIYRDNIDNGFVEFRDTATASTHYIWLATEQEYAVKAVYRKDGETVHAIDGCELEMEKISSQCDTICWFVRDKQLDLRLKY